MVNINNSPKMLPLLVDLGVFRQERFLLVDVGCSGGIHDSWRFFKDQLEAYGFDPQKSEIAKLSAAEENPNVRYFAYWVGLHNGHEFLNRKRAQQLEDSSYAAYFNPWMRLSCTCAMQLLRQPQTPYLQQRDAMVATAGDNLTDQKISISKFVREAGIKNIDMIKIDTDGSDLEVAISCEDVVRECDVLGFMIEAGYIGSYRDTENNFPNIDRFMRKNGYCLFAMSVHRYSRADLPSQFEYPMLAKTVSGQPIWGDLVYFRDAASSEYPKIWARELSTTKLLKLACLFELFSLPDCAAELINKYSSKIADIVSPNKLLDLLTPPLHGESLSYEQYMKRFREDPYSFYPRAATASNLKNTPSNLSTSRKTHEKSSLEKRPSSYGMEGQKQ